MRRLLVALGLMGLISPAFAADYELPILHGSQPAAPIAPVTTVGPATFTRWSGFYVGGQLGYNAANADFSSVVYAQTGLEQQGQLPTTLWPTLGAAADHGEAAYGGFIGYNAQWQDLILGIEANYNHTSISMVAPNSSIQQTVEVTSSGAVTHIYNIGPNPGSNVPTGATGAVNNLDDYGSLRARAGWILGDFLPYGFVGFALGQANVNVTANYYAVDEISGNVIQCAPCTGGVNGALYGLTAGVGMDVALTQNIFVRGEFEYVQFYGDVEIAILAARIGVGLKF